MSGKYWDPDDILARAADERDVRSLDFKQYANKVLEENLDFAVHRIVHIVKYTDNEKLAFDAAKYMLERILGRTPDFGSVSDKDELVNLVYEISDAERQAN